MASDNESSCVSDPNFAVICSFLEKFAKSCGISHPNMLELQEMLENIQEVPQPLIDLHVKLLRKARKSVSGERWEKAIIKFCHSYSNQDGWEIERFGYKKARISVKLRILKMLLELQFDMNVKFKTEVNRLSADELRCQPLGRDKMGQTYWCHLDEDCNLRVYREDLDDETWEIVARDRDGLMQLISQLSSNDPFRKDTEALLNEDSSSLEVEKPITDTGQTTELQDEAAVESHEEEFEEIDDEESEQEENDILDNENVSMLVEKETNVNNYDIKVKQKEENSNSEVDNLHAPKGDSLTQIKENAAKSLEQTAKKGDNQDTVKEIIKIPVEKDNDFHSKKEENYQIKKDEKCNVAKEECEEEHWNTDGDNDHCEKLVDNDRIKKKDGGNVKKDNDGNSKEVDVGNILEDENIKKEECNSVMNEEGSKREGGRGDVQKEDGARAKKECDGSKKKGFSDIKKEDGYSIKKEVSDCVIKDDDCVKKDDSDGIKKEESDYVKEGDISSKSYNTKRENICNPEKDVELNNALGKDSGCSSERVNTDSTEKEGVLKTKLKSEQPILQLSNNALGRGNGCSSEKVSTDSTEKKDVLKTKSKSELPILQLVTSAKPDPISEKISKLEESPLSLSSKSKAFKIEKHVSPLMKNITLQGNIPENNYFGMDLSKPSRSRPAKPSILSTMGIDLSSKSYKEEQNLPPLDKIEELNESSTSSSSLVAEDLSDLSKRLQPTGSNFEQSRFGALSLIATDLSTKRIVSSDLLAASKVPIMSVISEFGPLPMNRLNLSGKRLHETDLTNEAKKLRLEQTVAANCHKMLSSSGAPQLSHFDSGSFDSEDSAEVGEAIEEPLMLVRGEGSGADCNTGNPGKDSENGKNSCGASKDNQLSGDGSSTKSEKSSVSHEQDSVPTRKAETKERCELAIDKSKMSISVPQETISASGSTSISKDEKNIEKKGVKAEGKEKKLAGPQEIRLIPKSVKELQKSVTCSNTDLPIQAVQKPGGMEKESCKMQFSSQIEVTDSETGTRKITSLGPSTSRDGELLSQSPPKHPPKLWSIETICAPDEKVKDSQKIGVSTTKSAGNSLLGVVSDSLYGEKYSAESIGRLNLGSSSPVKRPSRWDVGVVGKPQKKGEAESNSKGSVLQNESLDMGNTSEQKSKMFDTTNSGCVEESTVASVIPPASSDDVTRPTKTNIIDSRVQVCQKQKFKFDIENIITLDEKKEQTISSLQSTILEIKVDSYIDKLQIAEAVSNTSREGPSQEQAETAKSPQPGKIIEEDRSDNAKSNSEKVPAQGFFFGPGCLLKSPIKKAPESPSSKDSVKASTKTDLVDPQEKAVSSKETTVIGKSPSKEQISKQIQDDNTSPKKCTVSSVSSSFSDVKNESPNKTNTSHSIDTIMKSPCKPREANKFPLQATSCAPFSSEMSSELGDISEEKEIDLENKLTEKKECFILQDSENSASFTSSSTSSLKKEDKMSHSVREVDNNSFSLKKCASEQVSSHPSPLVKLKGNDSVSESSKYVSSSKDLKQYSNLGEKIEKVPSKDLTESCFKLSTKQDILKQTPEDATSEDKIQQEKVPKELRDPLRVSAKKEDQNFKSARKDMDKIIKSKQNASPEKKIECKSQSSTLQMTDPGNIGLSSKISNMNTIGDKTLDCPVAVSKREEILSTSNLQGERSSYAHVPLCHSKEKVDDKCLRTSSNKKSSSGDTAYKKQLPTNEKSVKSACPSVVSQKSNPVIEKTDSKDDGKNTDLPTQISTAVKDSLIPDVDLNKEDSSNNASILISGSSLEIHTKDNERDETKISLLCEKVTVGTVSDDFKRKQIIKPVTSPSKNSMASNEDVLKKSSFDIPKSSIAHPADLLEKSGRKLTDNLCDGSLKSSISNVSLVAEVTSSKTTCKPNRDKLEKSEMKTIQIHADNKDGKHDSATSSKKLLDSNKDNIQIKMYPSENVSVLKESIKSSMVDSEPKNESKDTVHITPKYFSDITDRTGKNISEDKKKTTTEELNVKCIGKMKSGISISSPAVEEVGNETHVTLKEKIEVQEASDSQENKSFISTEDINKCVSQSEDLKKTKCSTIDGSSSIPNKNSQHKIETELSNSSVQETNVKNLKSTTIHDIESESKSMSSKTKLISIAAKPDKSMPQVERENEREKNVSGFSEPNPTLLLSSNLKQTELPKGGSLKTEYRPLILKNETTNKSPKFSSECVENKVTDNVGEVSEIKLLDISSDQIKGKKSFSSTIKAKPTICTSSVSDTSICTSKDKHDVKPIIMSDNQLNAEHKISGFETKEKDMEVKMETDKIKSISTKSEPVVVDKSTIDKKATESLLEKATAKPINDSDKVIKHDEGSLVPIKSDLSFISSTKLKVQNITTSETVTSLKNIETKPDSSCFGTTSSLPLSVKEEQKSTRVSKTGSTMSQTSSKSDGLNKSGCANIKEAESGLEKISETKILMSTKIESKISELPADKSSIISNSEDELKKSIDNEPTKKLPVNTLDDIKKMIVDDISPVCNVGSVVANVPLTSLPGQDSRQVFTFPKTNEKNVEKNLESPPSISEQKVSSIDSKPESDEKKSNKQKLLNLEKSSDKFAEGLYSQKRKSGTTSDKKLPTLLLDENALRKSITDNKQMSLNHPESCMSNKDIDVHHHPPKEASANILKLEDDSKVSEIVVGKIVHVEKETTEVSKNMKNQAGKPSTNIPEEKYNIQTELKVDEGKISSPNKNNEANQKLTSTNVKELLSAQDDEKKEIKPILRESPTQFKGANVTIDDKIKSDPKGKESVKPISLLKVDVKVPSGISLIESFQKAESSTKSLSSQSSAKIYVPETKHIKSMATTENSPEFQTPAKEPIKSMVSSKPPASKSAAPIASKTKNDSQNKGRRKSVESISMGIMMGKVAAKSSLQEPTTPDVGGVGDQDSKYTKEVSNQDKFASPNTVQSQVSDKESEKLETKEVNLESKGMTSVTPELKVTASDNITSNQNPVGVSQNLWKKEIEDQEKLQLINAEKLKSVELSSVLKGKDDLKKKDPSSQALTKVSLCVEKDKQAEPVVLKQIDEKEQRSLLLLQKESNDQLKGQGTSVNADDSSKRLASDNSPYDTSPVDIKNTSDSLSREKHIKEKSRDANKKEIVENKIDNVIRLDKEKTDEKRKLAATESISVPTEKNNSTSQVTTLVKEKSFNGKESLTSKESISTVAKEGKNSVVVTSSFEDKESVSLASGVGKSSSKILLSVKEKFVDDKESISSVPEDGKSTSNVSLFVKDEHSKKKESLTPKESISTAPEDSKSTSKVTSSTKEKHSKEKDSLTPKESISTAPEDGKSTSKVTSPTKEKHSKEKESLTPKESISTVPEDGKSTSKVTSPTKEKHSNEKESLSLKESISTAPEDGKSTSKVTSPTKEKHSKEKESLTLKESISTVPEDGKSTSTVTSPTKEKHSNEKESLTLKESISTAPEDGKSTSKVTLPTKEKKSSEKESISTTPQDGKTTSDIILPVKDKQSNEKESVTPKEIISIASEQGKNTAKVVSSVKGKYSDKKESLTLKESTSIASEEGKTTSKASESSPCDVDKEQMKSQKQEESNLSVKLTDQTDVSDTLQIENKKNETKSLVERGMDEEPCDISVASKSEENKTTKDQIKDDSTPELDSQTAPKQSDDDDDDDDDDHCHDDTFPPPNDEDISVEPTADQPKVESSNSRKREQKEEQIIGGKRSRVEELIAQEEVGVGSSSDGEEHGEPEGSSDEGESEAGVVGKRGGPASRAGRKASRGGRRGRGRGSRGRSRTTRVAAAGMSHSPVLIQSSEDTKKEEETPVPSTPSKPKSNRGKRAPKLMGLDLGVDIVLEQSREEEGRPGGPPVRQSRRIAQMKIREEAERRQLEEMTLQQLKEEQSRRRAEHRAQKKEAKAEKKKRKIKAVESDEDFTAEDVDEDSSSKKKLKKKKKRRKKKPALSFDESNPWQSSSGSSTSQEEEEEEAEQSEIEEEDDDELVFKSDHEFSPESDLENDATDITPTRRARTAQKGVPCEDEEQPADEHACQKCGKSDHPEWILLCDKCDSGWHGSCLRPALMVIPEGDWYCPPCEHTFLLENLHKNLLEFDRNWKRRENEKLRRKRLAYVGISLDNVLPNKEKEGSGDESGSEMKRERAATTPPSTEDSASESKSSSDEGSEPVYQLRQRRQTLFSYRFNEYDDLINSAIQDEMEAVKGAGNQGRGKDIATIVKAEAEAEAEELKNSQKNTETSELTEEKVENIKKKEEPSTEEIEQEEMPPVVPKHDIKDDEEDDEFCPFKKFQIRKKHRRLNSLDISSEDDAESDEDFKGTSSDDEEEEYEEGSGDSDDSEITGRRGKRNRRHASGPVRRSSRARITRFDKEFINDDSEDSEPPKKKSRRLWQDSDSEDSDASWRRSKKSKKQIPTFKINKPKSKKKKKKRSKREMDSDLETYKVKKPKIKYGGLEEDEEVSPTRRTRGRKINYQELAASDSEEETWGRVRKLDSEDEYVANEEDEEEEEDEVLPELEKESENEAGMPISSKKINKTKPENKAKPKKTVKNSPDKIPRKGRRATKVYKALILDSEDDDDDDDIDIPPCPGIPLSDECLDAANGLACQQSCNTQIPGPEMQSASTMTFGADILPQDKRGRTRGQGRKQEEQKKKGKRKKKGENNTSDFPEGLSVGSQKGDVGMLGPHVSVQVLPAQPKMVAEISGKGGETMVQRLATTGRRGPISRKSNPDLHPEADRALLLRSAKGAVGSDPLRSLLAAPPVIPPEGEMKVTEEVPPPAGKRRGRGRGKAAAADSSKSTDVGHYPLQNFPPGTGTGVGNAGNSSVITRMLQSQPVSGAPQSFTAAATAMGHKYFGNSGEPPMMPMQGAGRGTSSIPPYSGPPKGLTSPYRQPPPADSGNSGIGPGMGHYGSSPPTRASGVRGPPPGFQQTSGMRLRNPPPSGQAHLFHTSHHPMDPSPSGGGPIIISSNAGPPPPPTGSPHNTKPGTPSTSQSTPTPPPPPYSRPGSQLPLAPPSSTTMAPMMPFPSQPGDSAQPPVRHPPPPFPPSTSASHLQTSQGTQQSSPPTHQGRSPVPGNFSPYHPPPPANYHYGGYPPPPPMSAADDALPPSAFQGSPYTDHYTSSDMTANLQTSDGSNSKSYDEEGGGEFGGLVSYFSSQREDDLDT